MIMAAQTFTPPHNVIPFQDIVNPVIKRPQLQFVYIAKAVWELQQLHYLAATADISVAIGKSVSQTRRYLRLAQQAGWITRKGKRGGWYVRSNESLQSAA